MRHIEPRMLGDLEWFRPQARMSAYNESPSGMWRLGSDSTTKKFLPDGLFNTWRHQTARKLTDRQMTFIIVLCTDRSPTNSKI